MKLSVEEYLSYFSWNYSSNLTYFGFIAFFPSGRSNPRQKYIFLRHKLTQMEFIICYIRGGMYFCVARVFGSRAEWIVKTRGRIRNESGVSGKWFRDYNLNPQWMRVRLWRGPGCVSHPPWIYGGRWGLSCRYTCIQCLYLSKKFMGQVVCLLIFHVFAAIVELRHLSAVINSRESGVLFSDYVESIWGGPMARGYWFTALLYAIGKHCFEKLYLTIEEKVHI